MSKCNINIFTNYELNVLNCIQSNLHGEKIIYSNEEQAFNKLECQIEI